MSIKSENIKQVAHLARLHFNDQELPKFTEQFNQVISLIDQINQVDTSKVEPMSSPLAITQRLREDVVTEKDQREKMQQNAPQTEAGLYLVPTIIE
jgi:aspartyl-tRNA(Asn)/glutamyl-tRNA(Gln) amidotransferase subunit C